MKFFNLLTLLLIIIGGLNWGAVVERRVTGHPRLRMPVWRTGPVH
jgi:hypothetical protein